MSTTRRKRLTWSILGVLLLMIGLGASAIWWRWHEIAYDDWVLGHIGAYLVQSPSHVRDSQPVNEPGVRGFFLVRNKRKDWLPGPAYLTFKIPKREWDRLARTDGTRLSPEVIDEEELADMVDRAAAKPPPRVVVPGAGSQSRFTRRVSR